MGGVDVLVMGRQALSMSVDHMGYDELYDLFGGRGDGVPGIPSHQLKRLPTHAFPAATHTPRGSHRRSGSDSDTACSICLQPYAAGERLCELQCHHEFHRHCIDTWLGRQVRSLLLLC
jgi:hypothetical protein